MGILWLAFCPKRNVRLMTLGLQPKLVHCTVLRDYDTREVANTKALEIDKKRVSHLFARGRRGPVVGVECDRLFESLWRVALR